MESPPSRDVLDAEQSLIDVELSPDTARDLASRLEAERSRLLDVWVDRLWSLPIFRERRRAKGDLSRWAGHCLPHLARLVVAESATSLREQADAVFDISAQADFDAGEVVAGLLQFQELVLDWALEGREGGAAPSASLALYLKRRLCLGISRCATLSGENLRRRTEAEARRSAQLEEELLHHRARQQIDSATLRRVGLARVLELGGNETLKLMDADGVAVALLEDTNELRVAFEVGQLPKWAHAGLDRVARRRPLPVEPVLIDELVAEQLAGFEAPRPYAVVVPMRVHGTLVGALEIVNGQRAFAERDLRLAELIAEQLALAIEHTRLHRHQERMVVVEERNRLARDLHDSVTQSLYGVSALAEATARLLDAGRVDQAADHLRELRDGVLSALREMRQLIFELNPPDIEREGLAAVLQARLQAVESRSGIRTRIDVDDTLRLPSRIEKELFGIAMEAINNAVRHARAQTLELTLSRTGDLVRLTVADDGRGFDLRDGRAKGGLGLGGMEHRVARLGGHLAIDSEPGQGTRITVQAPLPDQGPDPEVPP